MANAMAIMDGSGTRRKPLEEPVTAQAIEVHRAAWRFSIWGPLLASYASLAWLCFFALGDKKARSKT